MKSSFCRSASFFALFLASVLPSAHAMDLDWSGQFRAESAMIRNYAPESLTATGGGYEFLGAGAKNAKFQTLFLRLQPKLIVNDNVVIKSEWWLGNPVTGFYGADYPGANRADQRFYNTNFSGGSSISAQRFWAEFLTDFGTFQVGRAPHHWGLGLIHHSGDGIFDRYQTTGDTFKMISKFGNFALIPGYTKYNMGNSVGGTCDVFAAPGVCTPRSGSSALTEFTIGLRYESKDEDFEGGVNMVRRMAGAVSDTPWINGTSGGMSLMIWDIYGKKKVGNFDFGVEAPIFNGEMVGVNYKAFALAAEVNYRVNDAWNFALKAGRVPGQPNSSVPGTDKWAVAYLHPNYRLGLLMFNYNFANFSGNNNANTLATGEVRSIYDSPITNANYAMLATAYRAGKWKFSGSFVTATAAKTAKAGEYFFNTRTRSYSAAQATADQGSSIGTEVDLGVALIWDEYTTFSLDAGMLMQGDFYKFGGNGENDLKTILGVVGSIGVKF